MKPSFFKQGTEKVAESLIGSRLVHDVNNVKLVGEVVETEAYLGKDDPASHAYNGMTSRNQLMFETYGRAYIYTCYGIHTMLNITSGEETGAVLIRAVKPLEGAKEMKKNRGRDSLDNLCDGPGKLSEAFDISKQFNGQKMTEGSLRIVKGEETRIEKSRRIGISKGTALELRFCKKGSEHVSQ